MVALPGTRKRLLDPAQDIHVAGRDWKLPPQVCPYHNTQQDPGHLIGRSQSPTTPECDRDLSCARLQDCPGVHPAEKSVSG